MKFLNPILLLLLVLSFAAWTVGEDNSSTAGQGSFVTSRVPEVDSAPSLLDLPMPESLF
jgi:hypothetical protein